MRPRPQSEGDGIMSQTETEQRPSAASWVAVVLAWAAVGLPLGWGVWQTLRKALVLFR